MVSDQEIASCVESVLRQSTEPAVSLPGVVRQVEAKLGVVLSHKATFIRDQIELLLGPAHPPAPQQLPPPTAVPHNPYILHHLPLHQQISPPQSTSSAGLPASAHFPQQHHPGIAFQYPPPPPLPAAAVVAAYHLQQQLQQTPQGGAAAVRPPPVALTVAATRESAPPKAKRRGGPGGLNKVCGVSPELQLIVGEAAMSRTQIVKQLWVYIRQNNLQDPNNKRKIICNDELRRVFETDSTDMFKMNKLLAKHIIPLDHPKDTGPESKKLKIEEVAAAEVSEPDSDECPLVISAALAKFLGSEESEMLQSEALKRVWDYIKSNGREEYYKKSQASESTRACYLLCKIHSRFLFVMDPSGTSIVCDTKLQELFGCENLPVARISDMLANNLFKKSCNTTQ